MPFLGVLLTTLALVPQSTGLQAKVQYSNPGAQAKTILAELSKATDIGLEAAPQTIHEVLAVRLNNVSLQEAMTQIAWAVDGGWKQVGNSYRLVRTAEQQREEERLLLEGRARKFKAMLDAHRAALAAAPEFNQDVAAKLATEVQAVIRSFNPQDRESNAWQRGRNLDLKGPGGRALDRLSLLFDPYELATMPSQVNVVYSSDPTPTQRPLGEKGLAALKQYIQEQEIWATEATRRQIHDPKYGQSTYLLGALTGNTEPLNDRVGKVLFIVSKRAADQAPQLLLRVTDTGGKLITDVSESLSYSEAANLETPPKLPPSITKMEVPPAVIAFQKGWESRNALPASSDLREKISQPEKFDTLGLGAGALLLAIAEKQKLSMVIDLSDELVDSASSLPEIAIESYLLGLTDELVDQKEVSGWLLMRPKWPSEARALQIDRSALGNYLRKLVANGKVTLDEQAEFYVHCPEDAPGTIKRLSEALIVGKSDEYFDENLLRLYGSMSPEQRLGAQKDGIPYSSLTPHQVHIVKKMLYSPSFRLRFEPQNPGAPDTLTKYELHDRGILREITEALPNGPAGESRLKLSSTDSEAVQCQPSGAEGYSNEYFSSNEYAYRRLIHEKPELFPGMQGMVNGINLDRIRFGTQATLTLSCQFTPELSLRSSVQFYDPKAKEFTSYSDLPESFRTNVETRMAELRKMFATRRSGGIGINTPPPP